MVDRINGAVYQGVWFSADVRFVSVTIDTGTTAFLTDLRADNSVAQKAEGVNSDLEQVVEVLSTRGTVIGMSVASDSVANFIVDYGQALDGAGAGPLGQGTITDAAVLAELEAGIEGLATVTASTVAVQPGFAPAAFGTPA